MYNLNKITMPKSRQRKKAVAKALKIKIQTQHYRSYNKTKTPNYFKMVKDVLSYFNGRTHAWLREATQDEIDKHFKGQII
jgi:hypothetical protein